jgi:hypothetical protein
MGLHLIRCEHPRARHLIKKGNFGRNYSLGTVTPGLPFPHCKFTVLHVAIGLSSRSSLSLCFNAFSSVSIWRALFQQSEAALARVYSLRRFPTEVSTSKSSQNQACILERKTLGLTSCVRDQSFHQFSGICFFSSDIRNICTGTP